MTPIRLVLAPPDLRGVLDVLRDWSAEGLLDPIAWMDGRDAIVVADGAAVRRSVAELLTSSTATTVVLAVVGAALPGAMHVEQGVIADCEQRIERALGDGTTLLRIRATATVEGSSTTVPTLATPGWHSVVMAAEQGRDPRSARVMVDLDTPAPELANHVAACFAGVLGLWKGLATTAFGASPAPQSPSVSIARSFVRHLDASGIEADLRAEVLGTHDGLPLPRVSGGAEHIRDVAAATATMEAAFWSRFARVLRSRRTPYDADGPRRIGLREALVMFLGFLRAAIRNAPRSWLDAAMRRGRAGMARTAQAAIFGTASPAYRIAVRGTLPDGRPASWSEVGEAVDVLAGATGLSAHPAHEDLSLVWRGYANALLTLCDAGERDASLPPIEVGARKGVLRDPADAVPGADARFDRIPSHLASIVGAPAIAPYDDVLATSFARALERQAAQPGAALEASATLDALRRWRRDHETSLASRVGARLAGALDSVRGEIASTVERLRRLEDDTVDERLARSQRRLARLLQVALGLAVLVLAVTIGLLVDGRIEGDTAAWTIGGTIVCWFLVSFVAFVIAQRTLFVLLNERRLLAARRDVDQRNLSEALRDARRLVDAYTQFLRWSEIVGAVLSDPFRAARQADDVPPTPLTGLPRSVVVGEARTDTEELETVAADIRRLAFEPGWLGPVLDIVVRGAHRRLGKRGVQLRDAPELLFRELGDDEHSTLPLVARHLSEHGVDAEAGDLRWEQALDLLVEHPALADRLLQRVHVDGRTMPLDEFTAGLETVGGPGSQTIEDSAFRADVRVQSGRGSIVASGVDVLTRGLSRIVVLRQRTQNVPDYDLAAYAPEQRPDASVAPRRALDTPVL